MAKDLTIRIMGDPSNLKNALGAAGGQVSKFSDRVTAMGKAAVIAGGIVMAAFTKAFLSFADYEQALIDMAKVTDEPFDKIEAKLKGLDPILGTSKELMKGYYQVISAGITDPVRALDTLTVSAKLAKSAHLDQSEVVKGLTKIMAGYEGAVESATEAADILYAIERYGQVAVAELIPIIGGLAKISHTLGINQREMAGAIALGSQTAGSAAEAGVQYEAILVGLMKPTEAMTKAIEDMGYQTAGAAIKELGLVGVLKKLQEATGGADDKIAELFGRKEAMLGFTALGAKGFTLLEENIRGVEAGTGAANEAFFKWSESSQASITGLQNRFKNFIKDVGRVLEEDINKMLDKVSEIIDSIDEWMKTYPDLFASIVKWTAKLAAWAVIGGTVAIVMGKIIKVIASLKAPLLWLLDLFTGLPVQITIAFDLAWLALKNFGEETPKWLSGLYDSFNKWWGKIVENTDNKWILMADKIKEALYTIADYTYLILDPLVDYIREGWNKDYDITVYWWNKIAEWMYKGLEVIVNIVKDNWYKISYTASYWWDQIALEIKQTWDRISNIFTTPLVETISNIWNDIKVSTGNIWDDIKLKTEIAWGSITKAITDRIDDLKDWIKEALPSLAKFISGVWEDIKADAEKIWTDILEKITGFWDRIKEIFTGEKKDEVVAGSKGAGEEAGEAFVTGLEDTVSPRIKKTMEDLAGSMEESGENIIEELSKGLESGNPRVKKAMELLTDEVAKPVRSRSPIQYGELKNLFDWGVNIPGELGKGIITGGDALGTIMKVVTEKNIKEPLLSVFGTILPEVKKETEKIKDTIEEATKTTFVPVVGLDKVIYDLRILEKQYEEIPEDTEYFTEKTRLLNKEHAILIANLAEAKTKFGEGSAEVLQATVQVIDNENATRRMVKTYEDLNKVVPISTTIIEAAQRANKAITNTIFEFTHLPYEVKIKEINEKYDDYIKAVKEANHSLAVQEIMIRNANIARDFEMEGVDKVTEAEKKAKEQKDLLAEATKDIKDRTLELTDSLAFNIQKLDEQKEMFEKAGVAAGLIAEWYEKAREALAEPPDLGPWEEFFKNLKDRYSDTIGAIQTGISNFVSAAQTALGDAFYNILSGAKTFEESMKDLWKSIIDSILMELARLAAFYVFKWIFGVPTIPIVGGIGYHQLGGEVKRFQIGGGTDSIIAAVTPGEYIIDKPMTDFIKRFKVFPSNLMDAIAGGLPTPAPAFAGGGPVGTSGITAQGFGETKIHIDIHDNRIASDVDIKRLAVTISDEVLRKIEMKRRH